MSLLHAEQDPLSGGPVLAPVYREASNVTIDRSPAIYEAAWSMEQGLNGLRMLFCLRRAGNYPSA